MSKKKQFIIDDLSTKSGTGNLQNISRPQASIKKSIEVLPNLKALIPPLSGEERQILEQSILREGIRDPLIIWEKSGTPKKYILVDGHNRFEISQKHGLDFPIKIMQFNSILSVQDWMILNQIGKRNLSASQKSYLRGKQYQQEKMSHGGKRLNKSGSSGQNVHLTKTADKLAKEHGISAKTIQRDAQYAEQIDQFTGQDQDFKWAILQQKIDIPKKTLHDITNYNPQTQQVIRESLKSGKSLQESLPSASPKTKTSKQKQSDPHQNLIKEVREAIQKSDKQLLKSVIIKLQKIQRNL